MTVVGLNPKITWQVTCQFCFWCWEINETLQLSFQRNVTLNLFYLWWSFHGQCYLDRKLKAISSKGVLEGAGEGVTIGLTCACTGCTACVFNFHLADGWCRLRCELRFVVPPLYFTATSQCLQIARTSIAFLVYFQPKVVPNITFCLFIWHKFIVATFLGHFG